MPVIVPSAVFKIVPLRTASLSLRIAALEVLSRAAEIVPEFVISRLIWQLICGSAWPAIFSIHPLGLSLLLPLTLPSLVFPGSPLKLIASEFPFEPSEMSVNVFDMVPLLLSVKVAMPVKVLGSAVVSSPPTVPNNVSTPIA